jgi:acetyl-CoA C-acetyltransferase
MKPDDLDVIEINEAYAATPLVSIRRLVDNDLGLEEALLQRTNINGGAVALGHPIGASGARLTLTAARQLRQGGGRWAAVAICGGFGQTDALLLESIDG